MVAKNTTSYPARIPGQTDGLVPDNSSMNGVMGAFQNAAAMVNMGIAAVPLASATDVTLTASQFIAGICDIAGSPGAGVTLRTPTAAAIIGALPNTIPKDGQFNFDVVMVNDDSGQTLTLTAGSGVTLLGTMTMATNTARTFVVNVNVAAGTVTIMNLGSVSL